MHTLYGSILSLLQDLETAVSSLVQKRPTEDKKVCEL